MTDETKRLIEEAEAHDKAATAGPWSAEHIARGVRHLERNVDWYFEDLPEWCNLPGRRGADGGTADGDFIAWARTAVPKLAAALRESEERANGIANVAQWRGVGLDNAGKIITALRADLAAASKALVALDEYVVRQLQPMPDMSGRRYPLSGKQVQAIVDAALARPGVAKAAEESDGD